MGNTYTVEFGTGTITTDYYGTEWLVLALWRLWKHEPEKKYHWKRLYVR